MLDSLPNSWILDLQHLRDFDEIDKIVDRFKGNTALRGWYIADEPDGAGDIPGAPIGFRNPLAIHKLSRLVRRIDETHPVILSLNCLHSAPL